MTEQDLNRFIQQILKDKLPTGSIIVRAKQNAPRPDAESDSPLFASVNVLTLISEGLEEAYDEDNIDLDITRRQTAMVRSLISINLFGIGARQWLAQCRMYFTQEKQRALFAANAVGLIRRTDVRDLSKLRHADFEERAHLDLEVYHHFEDTPETILSIESVRVEGELQETPDVRHTIIIEEPTP